MKRVALITGDGIGSEIVAATKEVLAAAGSRIEWVAAPIGQEALSKFGTLVPTSSLDIVRRAGVALKGPMIAECCSGGVQVNGIGQSRRHPSINAAIRRELGAFANLRPVHGWEGVSGAYTAMDIILVRELTEDMYAGLERRVDNDTAEAVKRITREASMRVARFACDYARRVGRKKITAVHKANVLHLTDGLFLECVRAAAAEYPELECDDRMVDATCYLLIKSPSVFDVLVLPNQYGDILSDMAAGLAGSLGLAPGGNIGDDVAIFEAAHGAAPDIAGKSIANPISLILSGAMLLDWIGQCEAAERVRAAVAQVLREPAGLTPDLGGNGTIHTLTEALCSVACV
jgi:isocitrate dehydrogenase (NAD+)